MNSQGSLFHLQYHNKRAKRNKEKKEAREGEGSGGGREGRKEREGGREKLEGFSSTSNMVPMPSNYSHRTLNVHKMFDGWIEYILKWNYAQSMMGNHIPYFTNPNKAALGSGIGVMRKWHSAG